MDSRSVAKNHSRRKASCQVLDAGRQRLDDSHVVELPENIHESLAPEVSNHELAEAQPLRWAGGRRKVVDG
jgi:hypothetical protein